jgi:hypothetical protein
MEVEEYGLFQQAGEDDDGGGKGPKTSDAESDLLSSSLRCMAAKEEVTRSPNT